MKLEIIIREFSCTTKTGEQETNYNFKALIRCSYDKPYRIKINTRQYESGSLTIHAKTELYFSNKEDMIKELEYQYNLCKNNLSTDFIKIIK